MERLKEKYAGESVSSSPTALSSPSISFSSFNHWSNSSKFSLPNSFLLDDHECDLWFCLKDYSCAKMDEFIYKIKNYIRLQCNRSDLILIQTVHPIFEYRHVLAETRRILAMFLSKSSINKTIDELISSQLPPVAKEHVQNLLIKFLNVCNFIMFKSWFLSMQRVLGEDKFF